LKCDIQNYSGILEYTESVSIEKNNDLQRFWQNLITKVKM